MKSKPGRIILVRHGESQGNVDREHYAKVPDYAVRLTDKGKEQAREAGKRAKEEFNVSPFLSLSFVSSYARTLQTYEQFKTAWGTEAINFRSREEPLLVEQSGGSFFAPWTQDAIKARDSYGTFQYRFSQGESAFDVYQRICLFLPTMFREYKKKMTPNLDIILVTHGMTLRVFLMRFLKWTQEQFETMRNPENGELFIINRNDEGYPSWELDPRTPIRTRTTPSHPFHYRGDEV